MMFVTQRSKAFLSPTLSHWALFDFSVQPPAVSNCLILTVGQTSPAVYFVRNFKSLWMVYRRLAFVAKNPPKWLLAEGQAGAQHVHTHSFSPSVLTFCVYVCVHVRLSLSVPLGALLSLGFGSDPGSGVRQACCCEAVGGWPGQHEDFGWVGRLDVVHSSNPSHPPPRVSAVCQVHFSLKVNISSAQNYRTVECQLGAKLSYMRFSIIAWDIAS